MKTIKEYVEARDLSLDDLKGALQLAMRLEFSTIPPYLCAQWSVKRDPDRVEGVLHAVVSQEMGHFALAGNLLAAIGGRPSIGHADFVLNYPVAELPGGIPQELPIDLKPLRKEQLAVFMQIETPEFPPVAFRTARAPATIGAFYDTIITTFQTLNPEIDPDAHAVELPFSHRIETVADAIETIDRIKSEGEGAQDSPDQPSGEERASFAHYYLFKELWLQKRLVKAGEKWSFSGASIDLPDVYDFQPSQAEPNPSADFNRTFSQLLIDLESCWTAGASPNVAAMFQLQILGRDLIKRGIRPEFRWDDGTS
ncbi:ferritin-like protein [Streptomyces sp. NPDC001812]|uniref:Ferritin-like protein n=1 Tax=Streptomyces cathayae TaxID=3031124 RepID=A0ABY8JWX7_9ACTN|nr:ferritin-like protein [Streptomyces sp. HUAS 5]WGD39070.1 ferritin-like protein [Streptomyces sp. HUAS 5]